MIELVFTCTFLSDVVLNAGTATEGHPDCLDFVPGSNFYGVMAKQYDSLKDRGQAYEIFHSGNVQFGDAHPAQDGQRALRMPAAWFYPKGGTIDDGLWVHHHIPEPVRNKQRKEGVQLKQVRSGFFFSNGTTFSPRSFFAVKSGYDPEKRRAEDGKLFGYNALRRGSQWQFSVHLPGPELVSAITDALTGEHHLGRSRSAQYGRVNITFLCEQPVQEFPEVSGEVALYIESRMALLDAYGQATPCPSVENLALPSGSEIVWDKCQIRTVTYAPWNAKRWSRDADRVCIDKGSVLVINLGAPHTLDPVVGAFKAEGLGQMLVNPEFLKADQNGKYQEKWKETEEANAEVGVFAPVSKSDSDDLVLSWLDAQQKVDMADKEILRCVNAFVKNHAETFEHITISQWGQVRAVATKAEHVNALVVALFERETGLLMHGKSKGNWKNAWKKLKDEIDKKKELKPIYTARLAAAMQKMAQGKGE